MELTRSELRTLRSLDTPVRLQKFLDQLPFHHADTAFSPRKVLRERTAHCFEGAMLAAAAFRLQGRPAWILDLEAVNDTDHVIAPFRENGAWGAVGMSDFVGLRYRPPVHRSLRELAMSYFNDYINLRRERTLRTFSQPVDMKRFDRRGWMTSEEDLWYVVDHLFAIPHTDLLTPQMEAGLTRVDARAMQAAKLGRSPRPKFV